MGYGLILFLREIITTITLVIYFRKDVNEEERSFFKEETMKDLLKGLDEYEYYNGTEIKTNEPDKGLIGHWCTFVK